MRGRGGGQPLWSAWSWNMRVPKMIFSDQCLLCQMKELTHWDSLWQYLQPFLWFEERTEPSYCSPLVCKQLLTCLQNYILATCSSPCVSFWQGGDCRTSPPRVHCSSRNSSLSRKSQPGESDVWNQLDLVLKWSHLRISTAFLIGKKALHLHPKNYKRKLPIPRRLPTWCSRCQSSSAGP